MGPGGRRAEIAFDEICGLVREVLAARAEIVDEAVQAKTLGAALLRLRDQMRANSWKAGPRRIDLDRAIRSCDRLTREDGFHVLHDWDGKAGKVNPDTIPVDVLHYIAAKRGDEDPDRAELAILLDYYFLNILALLSLRAWDDGRTDENLARLDELLGVLQGAGGSGETFADDVETLILVATCHYEPQEHGYETLLDAVRTLGPGRRTKIASSHAASMGSHLRFGFEATYARDTSSMRDDNVADYPWLCFALATLMSEYARLHDAGVHGPERDIVVEAMANGFLADPAAFIGTPPGSLSSCEEDRLHFRELFLRHRRDLVEEFERFRPSKQAYSPLSFFFNFSHNVIKGAVVDAVVWGEPWRVSFNDLLTGLETARSSGAERQRLATTLMGYARANPDRIRGRLMPVIVYDPLAGRQAFGAGMRKIREYETV